MATVALWPSSTETVFLNRARSQSIHTVVSEETEFSNALRIDFKKVAPGGIAS